MGRFITYMSRCKDASGFILFIGANEISRQTFQVKYVSARLFLATTSFCFTAISFHLFRSFYLSLSLSLYVLLKPITRSEQYKAI